jgi:DNA-binding winged helix-turn-helix (wHTH) protein/tetratricopeptide (TPR) repeat protein/TolB-like protein
MGNNSERILAFSVFLFNTDTGELLRKGKPLRIPTQAAEVLTLLLENKGSMVTREALKARLWPNGEVTDYDQSINRVVSQLRSILGERPDRPSVYIDTLPKRGYRFKPEVTAVPLIPTASLPRVPPETKAPGSLEASVSDDSLAASFQASTPVHVELTVFSPTTEMSALSIDRAGSVEKEIYGETTPPPSRSASRSSRYILAGALALTLASIAAFVFWRHQSSHQPREQQVLTLGLVPFETSGEDAAPLAESFRFDLADTLSQVPGIQIRAAHAFDHLGADEAEARRHAVTLGVSALVFGKFSVQHDRCNLQLELVRSSDGMHLASFQYSGTRDELTTIRDHVQKDVFLWLTPSGSVHGIAKTSTPSPKAYDAYLRGRYDLSQWNDESLRSAIAAFQESLQNEPDYARAYAGEATAYYVLAQHGSMPMPEGLRLAHDNAANAQRLDRSLAEPFAILGQVSLMRDWNFPLAEQQLHHAVELDPDHAMYRQWLAILYGVEGKYDLALQQVDKARAADPSWTPIYMTEIFIAGSAGDFDRANAASLKLDQSKPDWPLAHEQRAMLLWHSDRFVDAIAEWKTAASLEQDSERIQLEDRGLAAFRAGGVPAYAQVRLDAIRTRKGISHEAEDFIPAEWHAYHGDFDLAMSELEDTVKAHSDDALQIASNPAYAKLRDTPRFKQLLKTIGVPLAATQPAKTAS